MASCSLQIPRIPWTAAEDNELKKAVAVHGDKRWSQISTYLPGRTSKACSHRWRTYLQPGVMHASSVPFSVWEKAVVKEAHKAVGNNWAVIARMLPGRTNAAVKNFWYSYKRRVVKAQGKQRAASLGHGAAPASAAAGGAADCDDPSDSEDEGLESADEMDCEDGCEDGYEEECEDDDMAGEDYREYGCGHPETMEGVDCSASLQMAGQGLAGLAAAAEAATAADRWMVHVKQEPQAAAAAAAAAAAEQQTTPQYDTGHFGGRPWQYVSVAAAAQELYGSSGGAKSSGQYKQEPTYPIYQQQYEQEQQQPRSMRSCVPRRSSHHSWSGAPRSFPGDSAGDQDRPVDCADGPVEPVAWCTDMLAAAEPAAASAAAAGAAAAGAAQGLEGADAGPLPVGRRMQPRASDHGFLEPQHLGSRAGARYTNSNQLFEGAPAALPFQEHFTRQVTTAGAASLPGHVGVSHFSHSDADLAGRPHKFGLDLSVIKEAEPPAAAAAAADAEAVPNSMVHGAQLQKYHDDSSAGQSSHMAGSSGHSTGGQYGWQLCPQELQMILDAAARQMHTGQQFGDAGNPPEPQQQQQQQHLRFEQQVFMQGQGAVAGMLADGSSVARKLVRPSLCSDAGTGSPQGQLPAAAQALPGFGGALTLTRPAAEPPAGLQCTFQHIKQEPQHAPFDSAGQSYMPARYAGTGDGARPVGRRFVLDLSDDGQLY